MCIQQRVTYACLHYQKLFNPCPTYLKQQSSFLNRLLGIHKGENDCGYVRRTMETCANSCDRCAIQVEGMTTKQVGNGASIVQRQFVDESFRRERHDAARHALKRSERSSRSKKSGRHEIIASKNSVWVPEYYHHPKTVTEASYGRGYAPAPPVAPPRADEKSRRFKKSKKPKKSGSRSDKSSSREPSSHETSKERSKSRVREGHLTKGWEENSQRQDAPGVLSVSGGRATAFAPTQHHEPVRKPVEPAPALKPRGLRNQEPAGPPPTFHLPPLPAQARPNQGYNPKPGYAGNTSLPMAGQRDKNDKLLPPVPQAQYQSPRPIPPRPAPLPVPPPLYEVYLREQGDLKGGALPRGYVQAKDKPTPKAVKQEPRRTALESFGRAIGIEVPMSPADAGSDISFVCGGARQVERHGYNYGRIM